ncbi:hypothetical protein DPMN_061844 [Dreissena polymorpha]|uniref:Uncharacterized protein n=1 Tax=Dreissena polymorpha TaxID=45954 RepID=A0A9D4HJK2_DREPO|nr:hypothetical protein DPMN_061844 [Dreissena polymorpha]
MEELVQAIKAFLTDHMTVEQCNLYIDHLYKVVPICISLNGCDIGDNHNRMYNLGTSLGENLPFKTLWTIIKRHVPKLHFKFIIYGFLK